MPQIKIRSADLNDTNLIAVLGATTFYEAYREQDESHNLANYIIENFSPAQIRVELADRNSIFFIAYRDRKAVGYAKLRENSKAECVADENTIELQRLYVLPAVYGANTGARLLRRCFAAAKDRNYDSLWLSVWQENKRALRFYEKHGFRQAGTATFVYAEIVGNNLVLKKDLLEDRRQVEDQIETIS